jgi:hypothetical protein
VSIFWKTSPAVVCFVWFFVVTHKVAEVGIGVTSGVLTRPYNDTQYALQRRLHKDRKPSGALVWWGRHVIGDVIPRPNDI